MYRPRWIYAIGSSETHRRHQRRLVTDVGVWTEGWQLQAASNGKGEVNTTWQAWVSTVSRGLNTFTHHLTFKTTARSGYLFSRDIYPSCIVLRHKIRKAVKLWDFEISRHPRCQRRHILNWLTTERTNPSVNPGSSVTSEVFHVKWQHIQLNPCDHPCPMENNKR